MTRSILAASSALAIVLVATSAIAGGQPDDTDAPQSWIEPAYVSLGDTVTGALIEGDSRTVNDGLLDRFVLDLAAGTRVEVVMRSEAFDTFLIAGFLGADGFEQIALDDDGLGEGLNSRLSFIAAEAGRYEIRARGFAGMGAGDYVLSLVEHSAAAQGASFGSLAVGGAVSGVLGTTDPAFEWAPEYRYDAYRVQAVAGDSLEATVRSADFDTTLTVTRESRWGVIEQITFDDDGLGEGTNSRARFHVQEAGDYILQVSSYGAGGAGAYQLDLTRREPWPAPTPLVIGLPVSGEITNSDPRSDNDLPFDAYVLEAAAGQRFEILADSASFPTAIELGTLTGPSGWEALAFGDNFLAERIPSRLIFSSTEAGNYVVRVSASEAEMRGDYTLTVRDRGPLPPPPLPGSISVGDSLAGVLTDGDGLGADEKVFDLYDIRTVAGQRLSITIRSDVFDTYAEVYRREDDGEYTLVAEDDDSGGDLDSRVTVITDTGDYRIRVTSYSPGEIGDYSLAVRDLGLPAIPAGLRFGRAVDGAITDRDALTETETPYDAYRFGLSQGDRAEFVARSEVFDTFLIVARRDGEAYQYLAYDDDGLGDGTTNSRLIFVAEETADYELWIMPLDPATTGAYSLNSQNLGPQPASGTIAIGDTIVGELRGGDGLSAEATTYDGYRFQGTAGQRIRIDMMSADFDAYLLFGIHGEGGLSAIGENDDAAEEGTNASIAMTLPSDALYEVWATSFAPSEAGSYSLTLTDLGPEPEPGSLLVGATLRGALSGQDPVGADGTYFDGYRFEAAAGQAIRITATSNAFDAYLQLGRMDGRVFTVEHEDDDGLSDLNSLITFTPDEAGAYVVRVRSYSPGETGDYVLTVEDAPAE